MHFFNSDFVTHAFLQLMLFFFVKPSLPGDVKKTIVRLVFIVLFISNSIIRQKQKKKSYWNTFKAVLTLKDFSENSCAVAQLCTFECESETFLFIRTLSNSFFVFQRNITIVCEAERKFFASFFYWLVWGNIFLPLTVQFSNLNDAFSLTELGIQLSEKSFEPTPAIRVSFCLNAWSCAKPHNPMYSTTAVAAISTGKFNQQSFNYRLLGLLGMHMLQLSAPADVSRHSSN